MEQHSNKKYPARTQRAEELIFHRHRLLYLLADDGQIVIDQVIVSVVSTPRDLPTQPGALVAGPDRITLYSTCGVANSTIYLDSLNLRNSLS